MVRRVPFIPDRYYHLYNHAVGNENLFQEDDNYRYFMKVYARYAPPVVDTFAYCLMPNHFHLLIRVKPEDVLQTFFEDRRKALGQSSVAEKLLTNMIGQQIGNWLNAYAKAYNKRFHRRGRLFFDSIQRKPVRTVQYRLALVRYIHWNPVLHGFVDHPADWPFSSFRRLLGSHPGFLARDKLLGWYGSAAAFIEAQVAAFNGALSQDLDIVESTGPGESGS